MPTPVDYPYRPWSPGFSLGFGPLFPVPATPSTARLVKKATGGPVKPVGDQRPDPGVSRI